LVRRNLKVKQEELQNNSMQPHGQGPAQLRSVLRRKVWMPYQTVALTFKKESAVWIVRAWRSEDVALYGKVVPPLS